MEKGEIIITSSYWINKKERINKTKLTLEPSALGDYDILALYIRQLTESVQDLKNFTIPQMRQEIEKMAEKYENLDEARSNVRIRPVPA